MFDELGIEPNEVGIDGKERKDQIGKTDVSFSGWKGTCPDSKNL